MAKVKAKEKGARRERQAKKELEAQGYLVTKSGGSLGGFDLIAISPYIFGNKCLRLIQIKSNTISTKEKNKLRSIKLMPCSNLQKELWIYKDYKGKTVEIL